MALPAPPVSFTDYNETLAQYNTAATELDGANASRNQANADLQAAQAAYDQADALAEASRVTADEKLGAHVTAAEEIGVIPAAAPASYKRAT
jgi:hypothetical protein